MPQVARNRKGTGRRIKRRDFRAPVLVVFIAFAVFMLLLCPLKPVERAMNAEGSITLSPGCRSCAGKMNLALSGRLDRVMFSRLMGSAVVLVISIQSQKEPFSSGKADLLEDMISLMTSPL